MTGVNQKGWNIEPALLADRRMQASLLIDKWSSEELARLEAKAAAMRAQKWTTRAREEDARWRRRNESILNSAIERIDR